MRPQPEPALLEVQAVREVAVVKFTRRQLLDDTLVEAAGRQLNALAARGRVRLVVSFRGVDRFSSSLLSQLLALHKRVGAAGGRLALCALAPGLREVFQFTQLDKVF